MTAAVEAAYADLCAGAASAWEVAHRHGILLEALQDRCGEEGHDMQSHDSGDGVYYTFHGVFCDTCGLEPAPHEPSSW